MRTIDPEKHARQRAAIIAAARACFAREGFHRTSTERVRLEAGTSSGKLFHYFPSKAALILAVVEQQNAATSAWLSGLPRDDFAAAIAEFVDTLLGLASDADERRLILEIAAEATRDEAVAAAHAWGDKRIAATLSALLADAIAQGQARPPSPPDAAVDIMMMLVDGLFSRAAAEPERVPPTDPAAFHQVVRTLLGVGRSDADA